MEVVVSTRFGAYKARTDSKRLCDRPWSRRAGRLDVSCVDRIISPETSALGLALVACRVCEK